MLNINRILVISRNRKNLYKLFTVLIVIIGIGFIPSLGLSEYYVRYLTYVFMWIGLAESWNILYGYTGLVDFGHVVFFGFGAYTTAIALLYWSLPIWLCLILGIVVAAALALVIGLPTLRLYGAYFAIATWVFAEAMKYLALNLKFTGGSFGLSPPSIPVSEAYYFMYIAMLFNIITYYLIEKSKLGYGLKALGQSEVAAIVYGVNPAKYKTIAFILSAIFAGLIGSVYAVWIGYVYPYDAFEGLKTDLMVAMALVGGPGWIGPIIGSISIMVVMEVLWTLWTDIIYLIVLGIIIVAVVVFMPEGITGLLNKIGSFQVIKEKFSKLL